MCLLEQHVLNVRHKVLSVLQRGLGFISGDDKVIGIFCQLPQVERSAEGFSPLDG